MNNSTSYFYTIRFALSYINKYPAYWFWFVVRIVYVGMILATPILLGAIIDRVARGVIVPSSFYWLVCSYVGLLLVSPIVETESASQALKIANKAARDFRNDAVRLLGKAPIDFFKSKNRGSFLKIIDSAHGAIYRLGDDIVHRYTTSIGSVIGIFLSSFYFKPWVVAIFFFGSALSLANLVVFGKRERQAATALSEAEESFTGGLSEFLTNFKTIFYLNLFKRQEADLSIKINDSYNKHVELVRRSIRKWYNNNLLQQITTILIFIFGLLNVLHGNMTIGALTIILTFSNSLSGQMGTLLGYSEDYIDRTTSLKRYDEELMVPLKAVVHEKTDLIKDSSFFALSVHILSVARDERENLSAATFGIKQGEKVAIVGHTGGGKSTLLDVILKAITDYTGDVFINSVNYKELTGKDIASIFSIVPQEVQLFRGTLRENIASSDKVPSDKEIEDLLNTCELTSFAKGLPHGHDEMIFEGANNISGGERQRIGIARALFQDHPFLILDEATASLDPKTERALIEKIIIKYPSITLLYVTHKYALLDRFEKILVMDSGRIIEQGTFSELKENGPLFRELYAASKVS